jgi:uncharacterized protein YicC (UPF0701 family)
LGSVGLYFRTAVSGQTIRLTFKVQAVNPNIKRLKTKLTLLYKRFSSNSELCHLQDSLESHNSQLQNTEEEYQPVGQNSDFKPTLSKQFNIEPTNLCSEPWL